MPDGRLICWAQQAGHGPQLFLQDAGGGWKALTTDQPDTRSQLQVMISPAGDRAAAINASQLMLVDLASGAVHLQENWPAGAVLAGWMANGRGLFASQAKGDRIDLSHFDLATNQVELWKRIDSPRAMPVWARVTPDGRSYGYVYQVNSVDAFVVSGLR